MIKDSFFAGKNVLVCGMARSGVSAALLLRKLGAVVTAQDIKNETQIPDEAAILKENDVKLMFGLNPDGKLSDFELIIVSPGLPTSLPFFAEAERLRIPVWSEVELSYRLCENPIVAITGTNGKTTTTALTQSIFANYYSGSEAVGNIGLPFSKKVLEFEKTAYAIVEISSFQMETSHTFHPNISAVLNITPDHLNRHGTMENYIEQKKKVFKYQDKNDFLVLNYDDTYCREMATESNANVVFFSYSNVLDKGVFYKDGAIYSTLNTDTPELIVKEDELIIFGQPNLENAMAATAIALCAKIPVDIVRDALIIFKGFEHRCEYVKTVNGVDFYNDSKATNSDSAIKALQSMKKPVLLIAGGQKKGVSYADFVNAFSGKVKFVALIGETADEIAVECDKIGFGNYIKVNSLEEAVKTCFSNAKSGDCVLLSPACASWDMFRDFEDRGTKFKEITYNLG